MFDETYYAKDAWSLLQHGYVQDFVEKANDKVVAGDLTGLMTGQPTQITHPDGGKWIIAIGEQLFGLDSFGWRISAVVVGALTVLVLARLVRRLTGSTIIGCFAGLLLCFDGLHFVMSRIALLDGFLAFWIVSGVACLVADRDWIRERLDRYRVAAALAAARRRLLRHGVRDQVERRLRPRRVRRARRRSGRCSPAARTRAIAG